MTPSGKPSRTYCFGAFRLDGDRRVLYENEQPLNVRSKALDLLLILIERRGQPVSKDELLVRLWPDTEVSEHNLTVTVAAVRKALGEKSGENRYVATLPGHGYEFVAELDAGNPVPARQVAWREAAWRKAGWVAAGTVAILLALAFATVGTQPPPRQRTLVLTSTGLASVSAISPDGKTIAYASGTPDQQALLLRNIAAADPTELLPPASVRYSSIAFNADGSLLLFVARKEGEAYSSLHAVDRQSRRVTRLKENVDSIALSRDGKRILLARENRERGESDLVLASLESAEERILATRKLPAQLENPAWSPDGKRIACVEVKFDNRLRTSSIIEIFLDGKQRQIAPGAFNRVSALTWAGGDGALLASARDQKSGAIRLWRISPQNGEVHPLTNELSSMIGVSTNAGGGQIVTVQRRRITALWVASANNLADSHRVFFSDTSAARAAWLPDGNLLIEWEHGPNAPLGILNPHDLTVKPVLKGVEQAWMPTTCAEGEDVYYRSRSSSGQGDAIWRTDSHGSKPVELTPPMDWATITCGKDAYFAEFNSPERIGIWKLPRAGGSPVRLATHKALWPQPSPDGRWIASFYSNSDRPTDRAPENLAILPAGGGEPVRTFPLPPSVQVDPGLAWDAESSGLYFVQNRAGASGLWFMPLKGGEPTRLVDYPGEQIMHFAWSADRTKLVISRAVQSQDVVLHEGL